MSARPWHGPPSGLAGRAVAIGASVCLALLLRAAPAGAAPPQIHTFAGHGSCVGAVTSGSPCDNVPADTVPIASARSVATLPDGGYLYADYGSHLIRSVSPSGIVTTVAGDGTTADAPDGSLAVNSGLNGPVSVAALPGGGFLITEYNGSVVRVVSPGTPATATITTIAGIGMPTDNPQVQGLATAMGLDYPTDAEPTPDGRVLIADTYNGYVRLVSAPTSGATMTTVAGGGVCADAVHSCDGLPAGQVALDHPVSVSPLRDGSGSYLIAEYDTSAIRKVSQIGRLGTFTTVAGTPSQAGGAGDGGPAGSAQLDHPEQVLSTADGGFLVADTGNNRVRAVSATGIITTVAGSGVPGYAGDGGAATVASLFAPTAIASTPDGGFLIADSHNDAVRAVTIPPTTAIALSPAAPNGQRGWYVTKVHATVTATNAAQTRCQIDPAVAPPVIDVIPASCTLTGAGADITSPGPHTIFAASKNAAGDAEAPVGATLQIDTTPPTLTCSGAPRFALGARGASVTARVSDAGSGPATPAATAAVATTAVGRHLVTVVGADLAGNVGHVRCPYAVLPAQLAPDPRLTWTFLVDRTSARVLRLALAALPHRVHVRVTCQGKGCPLASSIVAATGPAVDLRPLFGPHRLSPGTKLTVTVTKPNTIGRAWVITIRSAQAPVQHVTCLVPRSWVPAVIARSRCLTR